MGQRGNVSAGDYVSFYGKWKKFINWEKEFWYATDCYQQLRENSLLVIGCHIQFSEIAGVDSSF